MEVLNNVLNAAKAEYEQSLIENNNNEKKYIDLLTIMKAQSTLSNLTDPETAVAGIGAMCNTIFTIINVTDNAKSLLGDYVSVECKNAIIKMLQNRIPDPVPL